MPFKKGHPQFNSGKTRFKKGLTPWSTGKKMTQDFKDKISKSKKGTTPWNKGKKCSFKHTEEFKRRASELMKQNRKNGKIPTLYGEKSGNWKGGITKKEYGNLAQRSWSKNKRNRVIKRLRIESLSHTWGEWELLKKQYGFTCPCCKRAEPEIKLTIDHIIPLSKGGSDLIENIQPLCLRCNLKKHTKIIKY